MGHCTFCAQLGMHTSKTHKTHPPALTIIIFRWTIIGLIDSCSEALVAASPSDHIRARTVEGEELVLSVDFWHGCLETLQWAGLLQAEGWAELYRSWWHWSSRRRHTTTECFNSVIDVLHCSIVTKETKSLSSMYEIASCVQVWRHQTGLSCSVPGRLGSTWTLQSRVKTNNSDPVNDAVVELVMDVKPASLFLARHPSSQVYLERYYWGREGFSGKDDGEESSWWEQRNGGSI